MDEPDVVTRCVMLPKEKGPMGTKRNEVRQADRDPCRKYVRHLVEGSPTVWLGRHQPIGMKVVGLHSVHSIGDGARVEVSE